jgi:hypothetical protein
VITAQKIVDLLNELVALDPGRAGSVHRLFETRFSASAALIDHPTCPVYVGDDLWPVFGILGVLNGIAAMEGKLIVAHFEHLEWPETGHRADELKYFTLRSRDGSDAPVEGPDGGQLLPQAERTEGGGPA